MDEKTLYDLYELYRVQTRQKQIRDSIDWATKQATATFGDEIEELSAKHAELKDGIINSLFPDPELEGTHEVPIEDGWSIKAVIKKTWEAIPEKVAELDEAFPKVFVPTFKLSKREYAKLTPVKKTMVDKAIVVKPGKVTLEFVAPKEV